MFKGLNQVILFIILLAFPGINVLGQECFTMGTADDETSTSGDWIDDGNWNGTSPGCDIATMNQTVEVDVDMTVQDTGCDTLTISGEGAALQVVNSSKLTIEGPLDITGESVCLYVGAGDTLVIEGDLIINNETADIRIEGALQVLGTITCMGVCEAGSTTFSGAGTIMATGGCSGDFGAECSSALPIELYNFQGVSDGRQVNLTWITASELNFDYFTIQRSVDSESYHDIGNVDGAGGLSHSFRHYSFIDQFPQPGLSFYRLKAVDLDGTFEIHKSISVIFESNTVSVKLFPNPVSVNHLLKINLDYLLEEPVKFRIINMMGLNVLDGQLISSNSEIFLPQSLAPGVYLVEIGTGLNSIKSRIVIQ